MIFLKITIQKPINILTLSLLSFEVGVEIGV